jgi:hypothetical protein
MDREYQATGGPGQPTEAALWDLVGRLPEELRIVIVARYGLAGQGRTFYGPIGARLGLSAERARQLHTGALIWLRQPAHSQRLRSLLGRHTLTDYEAVQAETQRWPPTSVRYKLAPRIPSLSRIAVSRACESGFPFAGRRRPAFPPLPSVPITLTTSIQRLGQDAHQAGRSCWIRLPGSISPPLTWCCA